MKKEQVIRNYNDANKLLDKGHRLVNIDRDVNNREFLIFWFDNSEKLQDDLREITAENRVKKTTY